MEHHINFIYLFGVSLRASLRAKQSRALGVQTCVYKRCRCHTIYEIASLHSFKISPLTLRNFSLVWFDTSTSSVESSSPTIARNDTKSCLIIFFVTQRNNLFFHVFMRKPLFLLINCYVNYKF
jgi:hypothetical protein